MNWWAVTGSNRNNWLIKAVVCEERGLGRVREEMGKTYPIVEALPAECDWTAEIRVPTEPADVDGIERW